MLVEFGNESRLNAVDGAPAVTYVHVPDSYTFDGTTDAGELRRHLTDSVFRSGVTRLPENEALVALLHPLNGVWASHGRERPTWVWSDNADLGRVLSEFDQIPFGRPDGVHDTHWTVNGSRVLPPGVVPAAGVDLSALVTNAGRLLWAHNMGGGQAGYTGEASASSSTSLTASSASWGTNQWAGYQVYAAVSATAMAWGNIISNTSDVLTVDQWYSPSNPGGGAASVPSATGVFIIPSGGSDSAWWVGVTGTNITPSATDTSLSGEQTANGLQRKVAPFALTSGTSPVTYTLTPVFTYTGSTSVTLYAIGVFTSGVVGDSTDTMAFETTLNASATVNTSGDQVTITETVTGP